MTTYTIDAGYHAGASANVAFPEGKTWEDVKDWYVKWDILHVQFEGELEMREFPLNSDSLDVIDWKRPTSVSVYATDDEGNTDYDVEIAEAP